MFNDRFLLLYNGITIGIFKIVKDNQIIYIYILISINNKYIYISNHLTNKFNLYLTNYIPSLYIKYVDSLMSFKSSYLLYLKSINPLLKTLNSNIINENITSCKYNKRVICSDINSKDITIYPSLYLYNDYINQSKKYESNEECYIDLTNISIEIFKELSSSLSSLNDKNKHLNLSTNLYNYISNNLINRTTNYLTNNISNDLSNYISNYFSNYTTIVEQCDGVTFVTPNISNCLSICLSDYVSLYRSNQNCIESNITNYISNYISSLSTIDTEMWIYSINDPLNLTNPIFTLNNDNINVYFIRSNEDSNNHSYKSFPIHLLSDSNTYLSDYSDSNINISNIIYKYKDQLIDSMKFKEYFNVNLSSYMYNYIFNYITINQNHYQLNSISNCLSSYSYSESIETINDITFILFKRFNNLNNNTTICRLIGKYGDCTKVDFMVDLQVVKVLTSDLNTISYSLNDCIKQCINPSVYLSHINRLLSYYRWMNLSIDEQKRIYQQRESINHIIDKFKHKSNRQIIIQQIKQGVLTPNQAIELLYHK